jgi:hypothetical protein
MEKYMKLKLIGLMTILLVALLKCSSEYNYCETDWKIFNKADSTLLAKAMRMNCTLSPSNYNHEGPFWDSSSTGILKVWFIFDGKREDFLNSNPSLSVSIIRDSKNIYDSTYNWKMFNFIVGKDKGGDEGNLISTDSIYLDTNKI